MRYCILIRDFFKKSATDPLQEERPDSFALGMAFVPLLPEINTSRPFLTNLLLPSSNAFEDQMFYNERKDENMG